MFRVPTGLMGTSGEGATAAAGEAHESRGASGGSSEVGGPSSIPAGGAGVMEEYDRSGDGGGGGTRWPRQETLALLKIRSDMDGVFKDASLKGPLWEGVSRKMAELGFRRSAKKCKEKFENVYKYHKRTKDGRSSKPDGKSYRFFDQLEALENTPPNPFTQLLPPPSPAPTAPPPRPHPNPTGLHTPSNTTVSSNSPIPNPVPKTMNDRVYSPAPLVQQSQLPSLHPQTTTAAPAATTILDTKFPSNSTSSSSSTSSDEDIQKRRRRRRGRKRKWKDYFERLMRDVVQKQEEMQNKFLDALDKCEHDRMAREEAWRAREMARMNREHDLLVQERSITSARDTTMIAFLHRVTNEHNAHINNAAQQAPPPEKPRPPPTQPPPTPAATMVTTTRILEMIKTDNSISNDGGPDNFIQASSSRWPRAEIEALIKLRTSLDIKYQENGPKGPLWEEISAAMAKLGYSRNAKRCKEKWENINKYYKKVKESNRKRPEDSKTCPYFHLLEEIYKEKAGHSSASINNPGYGLKPENLIGPIMARPEQQWPLSDQQQQRRDFLKHDNDDSDQNNEDYDEEDDDDEEGEGYEIIAGKHQHQPSSMTNRVE
ncbi:hypothetical protein OROMI_030578 [Orobanche minor]